MFALGLLSTRAGQCQEVNPTLLALPDGQWSELPNTAMSSAGAMDIPCCDWGTGCSLRGIFDYSGATLDRQRGQIVVWGGGHNDYFGNQLLIFDIATLTWRLETTPTSLCLFSDPPDYKFTNGDPVARHTYDHIGVIDHLGFFFSFSGATSDGPPFNGGDSYGDLWTYDLVGGGWTDHTPFQTGDWDPWNLASPGASGEYDPVTQLWFHNTQYGIWSYDFVTRAWTKLNEEGHPGIERVTVLDPVRRRLWSYGGDYGGNANLSYYDIDSNQFEIAATTGLPGSVSAAGLAYDSANDHLVVYGGSLSTSVYNFDISESAWAVFPGIGNPPAPQAYGRFLYDPTHNLFFLIADTEAVWVWKNTLGAPTLIFRDDFESGDEGDWDGSSPR